MECFFFPYRGHPERPSRITSIYELLNEYGLVDRCHSLQAREATRKELSMLHDSKYIDLMASIPKMKPSTLNDLQRQYGSVFLCPESYQAAVLSAGSAIEVCYRAIIIICCNLIHSLFAFYSILLLNIKGCRQYCPWRKSKWYWCHSSTWTPR